MVVHVSPASIFVVFGLHSEPGRVHELRGIDVMRNAYRETMHRGNQGKKQA
jgi:hypothetical protein